jgi:tetratricopeptide (TPR) repeat protein
LSFESRGKLPLEYCRKGGVTRHEELLALGKQEHKMINLRIKLVALGILLIAVADGPSLTPVFAAGGGGGGAFGGAYSTPDPPPSHPTRSNTKATHQKGKKNDKQSFLDDPAFRQRYGAAYDTIYGHDDYANVANLIGYSYRKLGDYELSQVWYERALKSDPNHVLTWNYYGFWQIERGNRDQAEYHLSRIAAICGTDCAEYRSLAVALEQPPGTGLVY